MPNIDTASVLDCPMDANDADASTVREYLSRLLAKVWTHADSFSGNAPSGTPTGSTRSTTRSWTPSGRYS
jgi:hypothetical protein